MFRNTVIARWVHLFECRFLKETFYQGDFVPSSLPLFLLGQPDVLFFIGCSSPVIPNNSFQFAHKLNRCTLTAVASLWHFVPKILGRSVKSPLLYHLRFTLPSTRFPFPYFSISMSLFEVQFLHCCG